jgi:hypothetical protein
LLAIIVSDWKKFAHPIDDYYAFCAAIMRSLIRKLENEKRRLLNNIMKLETKTKTLYFVGLIIVVQILLGTGIGLLWGYQKIILTSNGMNY